MAGFLAAAGLISGAASAAGHGLADSHKRAGDVGGADVIFQTATADDVFCLEHHCGFHFRRAAAFQGVLNGDNLPPLAVRTEKTSGKGVMTDVDFHAFGGAGASPVKQFTRPERVGVVRQRGRGGEIGRAQVAL